MSRGQEDGALAIVLHTHMPYVEGFGTWPFGEEWLWEAIATSYLPLLDLLDEGAPLTLSLTPVLCDQLEAEGVGERFAAFAGGVRRETHEEDARGLRESGYEQLAAELDRSLRDYEGAVERFSERGGDLLSAFAPHVQWTSSATHAVLPLLATEAGLRVQAQAGIDAHRERFGDRWQGGFWLPECAHSPDLEPALLDAGVRACCVELTGRFGLGAPEHLHPLLSESGLTLVPIDRQTISLVWSEGGYPAHGLYRDYHRHTVHHHNPWRNDGEPYDHQAALALAGSHAADFVERVRRRLSEAAAHRSAGSDPDGAPLVVCALDTELLGHWWYEGPAWLRAVVEECSRQGLRLVRLDEALASREPVPVGDGDWPASSWGSGGDLSTWSGPAVAEIAFAQRSAELALLRGAASTGAAVGDAAAGPAAGGRAAGRQAAGGRAAGGRAALRELMAMQSSDWAFMVSRDIAVPYARERFKSHSAGFRRALSATARAGSTPATAPGEDSLRNLAVHADPALLSCP